MEIIPHILSALAWPLAIFGVAFMFRKEIKDLFSHVREFEAKGIKLIVQRLEKEGRPLSIAERAELSGLSAHDIWALDSFATKKMPTIIELTPAQRVAARTLLDAGLVGIHGEGSDRHLEVTPFGETILNVAKSLL